MELRATSEGALGDPNCEGSAGDSSSGPTRGINGKLG